MACRLGNIEVVELLLGHGSDAPHRDYDGLTPKDVALTCEYPKLADTIQRAIDSTQVSVKSRSQIPRGFEIQDTAQENYRGGLPFHLVDPVEP